MQLTITSSLTIRLNITKDESIPDNIIRIDRMKVPIPVIWFSIH